MKDFASKLNLYETLSMLIPGSAILFFIVLMKFDNVKIILPDGFNNAVVLSIIWFVLAYLIGILHNIIMDWWWQPFRNNPAHICFIYNQSKVKGSSLQNSIFFVLRALCFMFITILSPVFRLFRDGVTDNESIIGDYYRDYYIAEKRENSAISSLEQQVAFMRNMLLPLILLVSQVENMIQDSSINEIKALMGILIIVMTLSIVKRQEKIYSCVKEDAKYQKKCSVEMQLETSITMPSKNFSFKKLISEFCNSSIGNCTFPLKRITVNKNNISKK